MIKKILFVSLLLAGGTLWASAQSQTTEETAASLPVSKKENMTISQLFQKVEDNSKSLRTSLSGVEAAHLGIESAKSKKLPDLDASLSFSYIGNALITDRDFSNVHGLGRTDAVPALLHGIDDGRHHPQWSDVGDVLRPIQFRTAPSDGRQHIARLALRCHQSSDAQHPESLWHHLSHWHCRTAHLPALGCTAREKYPQKDAILELRG